ALAVVPEVLRRAARLDAVEPAEQEPRHEPQARPERVLLRLAPGRGDRLAQHDEAALAPERAAHVDFLRCEIRFIEAADGVEGLARAEEEAARGPAQRAEERHETPDEDVRPCRRR